MASRVLPSLLDARLDPEAWSMVARDEPPVSGKARGCAGCPLRLGGEWEAGALATLPACSQQTRKRLERWGCHEGPRPCAGMRRVLAATAVPRG